MAYFLPREEVILHLIILNRYVICLIYIQLMIRIIVKMEKYQVLRQMIIGGT